MSRYTGMTQDPEKCIKLRHTLYTHGQPEIPTLGCHSLSTTKPSSILGKPDNLRHSPRFLCRPTCWSRGTSESSIYRKQRICCCNSALAHFHVSWLSDFIFYPKPLYKSLHQSFFYSFITILPSESGVTIHYSTMLPHNY